MMIQTGEIQNLYESNAILTQLMRERHIHILLYSKSGKFAPCGSSAGRPYAAEALSSGYFSKLQNGIHKPHKPLYTAKNNK